jgi:competence protein ComEA
VPLFTKRDKIAIGIIMTLIIAGWTVRYVLERASAPQPVVIRNAVPLPAAFTARQESGEAALPLAAPLDLNTATAEELATLPRIGPVKAAAIVEYRKAHGPFRGIDDIIGVSGIGPATLARIRSGIVVALPDSADSPGVIEK